MTRDVEAGVAVDGSSGRGELRLAIEGLLRTCVELDRQTADVGRESLVQARSVARHVGAARLPSLADLADEIAAIGQQMDADVVGLLSGGRRGYVMEVHRLLGLLAPHHGVTSVPPLVASSVVVPGAAGIGGQFPPGFARDYVADLLAAVEKSRTLTVLKASRLVVVPDEEVTATKTAAGGGFAQVRRVQGGHLLEDVECHAVELHGPQVPDVAQLARLVWLRDATGTDPWHADADGKVVTDHYAGTSTGGFTSPEALAKPLDALLAVAHEHGGLDKLLDDNANGTRIMIHVGTQQSGLQPGDAFGYRGAGTGTIETRRDWIKAREFAMGNGTAGVYGVPYDPVADGVDPGAKLVLKRLGTGWRLVTCYPVEAYDPNSRRLEDLT